MATPKTKDEVQEEIDLLNILNGRIPGRGAKWLMAPLMRINQLVRDQMATATGELTPAAEESNGDGEAGEESGAGGKGRKRRQSA